MSQAPTLYQENLFFYCQKIGEIKLHLAFPCKKKRKRKLQNKTERRL